MKMQDLLGLGMMPSQISPAFNSADFARVGPHLSSMAVAPPEGFGVVRHNLARPGGLRRRLEIPNPFAYMEISRVCTINWDRLRHLAARSKSSITRPLIDPRKNRALAYLNEVKEIDPRLSARMAGGKYTLHTDISSFFDSIYTHSLDWAIQGKESAKKNFSRKKPINTLGRQFDRAFQRARFKQTSGISVGPDASTLAAEVLLGAVDERLSRISPRYASHSFRYVDDVTFYATSQSEAEDVLAIWQSLLADYELSVNPTKTFIAHGPSPIREPWIISLAHARLRDSSDAAYYADLEDLFSLAFQLRRDHPHKGVLAYAIKRANPFPLGRGSWSRFVDFLLTVAVLDAKYAEARVRRTHFRRPTRNGRAKGSNR